MFIDDDTIFTQGDCIENMIKPMNIFPEINLVAGTIKNNDYYGTYELSKNILIRHFRKKSRSIGCYNIYHFVVNLFLARTDVLKSVRWNDTLKICEHTDFFYRGQGILMCTVVNNAIFINDNQRDSKLNKRYNKFRRDRVKEYQDKQLSVLGVNDFKDIK